MAGDFNIQLAQPRNDEEQDLTAMAKGACDAWEASVIPPCGATHDAGTRGRHQLDYAVLSHAAAAQSAVGLTWHRRLSDHAALHIRRTSAPVSTARQCTPQGISQLPPQAFADLRCRYEELGYMFQVPRVAVEPSSPTCSGEGLPRAGEISRHDVLRELVDPSDADDPPGSHAATPPPSPGGRPDLSTHTLQTMTQFGYHYQHTMLTDWWKRWRRHSHSTDVVMADLGRARRTEHATPLPALHDGTRQWLEEVGFPGSELTSSEAARWMGIRRLELSARASLFGTGRPRGGLTRTHRHGRHLFRQRQRLQGVLDGERWVTRPQDVEALLWASREHIWAATPATMAAGAHVLDQYFDGRSADFPEEPPWGADELARHILRCSGSAAGVDGVPYELYHFGVNFTVCLLQCAWIAARDRPRDLECILGPSVDLLIWIPKASQLPTPNGLRGLQLPSCVRRLFGASLAASIGPCIEPHLSAQQQGVRRGLCRNNIEAAFRHLDEVPAEPAAEADPGPLWHAVLGPLADVALEWTATHADPVITSAPAVLCADQSKAFERMSHSWLGSILHRWRMPPWAVRGFLAGMVGRSVVGCSPDGMQRPRRLGCGLGMGGTSSPLAWTIGYDPVVDGLAVTLSILDPTFVDDLAALLRGPVQTSRAQLLLVCLSRCAGLQMDGHTCIRCQGPAPPQHYLDAIARCSNSQAEKDGVWTCTDVPVGLLALAAHRFGLADWWRTVVVTRVPCSCKTKTAVVPQAFLARWRAALEHSWFGGGAASPHWPYLGITLASPFLGTPGARSWHPHQLATVASMTWGRAVTTIIRRSTLILGRGCSAGLRGGLWNTYANSCAIYPGQVCPPTAADSSRITQAFGQLFRTTGWIPWWMIVAMGLLLGVRGAPRCPLASSEAAGLMCWLRGARPCPAPMHHARQALWRRVTGWAAGEHAAGPSAAAARVITDLHAQRQAGPLTPDALRGRGQTLYQACWLSKWQRRGQAWLQERAARRVWWPTDGREWLALRGRSLNQAYHLLRLYSGGIRPRGHVPIRQLFAPAATCFACGLGPAAHRWRRQDALGPETRICSACLGACVAEDTLWQLHPLHTARGATEAPVLPPAPVDDTQACPLCGHGAGDSEHLLRWCPAVRLAWQQLAPEGAAFLDALLGTELSALAAATAHQASFLLLSLRGHVRLEHEAAARKILRFVRGHLAGNRVGASDDADQTGSELEEEDRSRTHLCATDTPRSGFLMWSLGSCCGRSPPRSCGRDPCGQLHTTRFVQADQCVLRLHCTDPHGLWPLTSGPALPPPRTAPDHAAGFEWAHDRCSTCGAWTLQLIALRSHSCGETIVAATSEFIHGAAHLDVGTRVWFDGATAGRRAGAAASAAAVLRHTGADAPVHATRRLPTETGSAEAECEACILACEALVAAVTRPRTAVVFGDHAQVIRHALGASRLREPVLAVRLDQALARVYSSGWHVTWVHIHRTTNGEAHTLARRAARW